MREPSPSNAGSSGEVTDPVVSSGPDGGANSSSYLTILENLKSSKYTSTVLVLFPYVSSKL